MGNILHGEAAPVHGGRALRTYAET